ncbi:hypothetical protein V1514DRAFT_352734 [Lipomyces japonicus]|uniref:uncharacterized protein n=1 Tax=Lipomyces japonicus TaxID=56871 RepID=UPI0034CE78AE
MTDQSSKESILLSAEYTLASSSNGLKNSQSKPESSHKFEIRHQPRSISELVTELPELQKTINDYLTERIEKAGKNDSADAEILERQVLDGDEEEENEE